MKARAVGLIVLIGLAAAPLVEAQGRGPGRTGVPPGHLPPAGECRVWYDGVPPGQQPRPTSCREAELIASRSRGARVIYGDDRDRDGRVLRERGRTVLRPRAVPRSDRYPADDRYPSRYPGIRDDRFESAAFQSGYRDGVEKGREDLRDGDSFDPNRHRWYRSADRGYNSRYGSREQYRAEYRDGFLRGYDAAYGRRSTTDGRRPRIIRER